MTRKKKSPRSPAKLSTLDDFLKQDGKLDEFQATAIKEVLAWQIAEAMKANNISRSGLATRMKTSRSQIGRLLDPKDGNAGRCFPAQAGRQARMRRRRRRHVEGFNRQSGITPRCIGYNRKAPVLPGAFLIPSSCRIAPRMPRSVAAERKNLRRQRLRIERDPIQQRGERELALVSADDDDAAGNTVELIGCQSLVLDGSKIGHGRFPLG